MSIPFMTLVVRNIRMALVGNLKMRGLSSVSGKRNGTNYLRAYMEDVQIKGQ